MFLPIAQLHHSPYKRSATHNSLIRSDEGLTLETSAFNLFTVANLTYQRNSVDKSKILSKFTSFVSVVFVLPGISSSIWKAFSVSSFPLAYESIFAFSVEPTFNSFLTSLG